MKVILLAAGKGSRISKSIGDIPKSLVDVQGVPLLRRTVEMLKKFVDERDISIVTGYRKDSILSEFKNSGINFFVNPFYTITNSIASLWFAFDKCASCDEDLIIANADVFWTEEIFRLLASDGRAAVMLTDKSTIETGDYFFALNDDGTINKYGKDLPLSQRSCEYLGVAKLGKEFVPRFKNRLAELIDEGSFSKWWEDVLYSLSGETKVYSRDVEGRFWAEVDYIEDYKRILDYTEKNK